VRLRQSLKTSDGLALVVGIMIGSGIFRTPGLVAQMLGRPWLTFVAWALGGAVAFLGALVFAELATRFPQAGGKYVYARETWGRRAGFVFGWLEALGIYAVAIAAIAVVGGEYVARLFALPDEWARVLGAGFVVLFTALNLVGVAAGRFVQNVTTAAKVGTLLIVVALAFRSGTGAGWTGSLPNAPSGGAAFAALAIAFQGVIWTYYGYIDGAKVAEEVKDPDRSLPRIFLIGTLGVMTVYLLLNAAFLHALPFEKVAASKLVAGDVALKLFGPQGDAVITALALLVVLAGLNGNIFVVPRVIFGLSRDGLGPRVFTKVNAGGTPWTAMLLVGAVSAAIAVSGTFEQLFSLAITLVLVTDGAMVVALFRLRARGPSPFTVPLSPWLPAAFLIVYAVLFVTAAAKQPGTTAIALGVLAASYVLARVSVGPE
jgi:basic amino acid/polyamine antiporter, APA family